MTTSVVLKIVEVFVLMFIAIGAFTGNAMLFALVAKTPGLQTKGNIFILNLATADFMVALISMPITLVEVISEDWILGVGEELCLISGFFTLLTFVASCMALTMISVNRYHAIVHWTTYHNKYTRRKCVLYVAIVWIVTIGLSIPPFFGWAKFSFNKDQSCCFAEWSTSKSYAIFMISSCLFGPLAIMFYCYVKIIFFQRESERLIIQAARTDEISKLHCNLHPENIVCVVDSPGTVCSSQTFSARSSGRKLLRTITFLIAVFALCWSPFSTIIIIQVFFGVHVPRYINFGCLILGYMNSFLNVFVYNATNRDIRQAFKKFLRCDS